MYQYIYKKDHNQLDTKFSASVVATLIQDNLVYIISSIQEETKLHYKFKISYYKTWAVK
jgi:hypothetical protein